MLDLSERWGKSTTIQTTNIELLSVRQNHQIVTPEEDEACSLTLGSVGEPWFLVHMSCGSWFTGVRFLSQALQDKNNGQ